MIHQQYSVAKLLITFYCITDQRRLNSDEELQVENGEPSIEEIISLLEKKNDIKIKEYDMRPEVNGNLASKFGQKIVSSSHVSMHWHQS